MSESLNAHSAGGSSGSSVDEQKLFNEKLRFLDCEEPLKFGQGTSTRDVLAKMRETRTGGVLVHADSDPTQLLGIFTIRDYLDKLAENPDDRALPIEKFMTSSPKVLGPNDTVGGAIQLMTVGGYRHVPVLGEDGAIFGLVSVRDIVNFIAEYFPEEVYNHPPIINQQMDTQEGG